MSNIIIHRHFFSPDYIESADKTAKLEIAGIITTLFIENRKSLRKNYEKICIGNKHVWAKRKNINGKLKTEQMEKLNIEPTKFISIEDFSSSHTDTLSYESNLLSENYFHLLKMLSIKYKSFTTLYNLELKRLDAISTTLHKYPGYKRLRRELSILEDFMKIEQITSSTTPVFWNPQQIAIYRRVKDQEDGFMRNSQIIENNITELLQYIHDLEMNHPSYS